MDRRKPYKQIAEEILEQAKKAKKGSEGPGYKDEKCYVQTKDGIEALIGAGGLIFSLNAGGGKTYIHEVKYKDHLFILATPTKQFFEIHGSLC